MQEKLTIQDIARFAGVSKATVSRVLNNNPTVDAELAERVKRVVEEHGFVRNATATGLAGGRTNLIGVLAPPLTWPAVPEIMRGVAEYIDATNYEIVLYSINFERNHADVLERILSMRMISGLLAILPGELSRHLTDRFFHGLPMVLIDDQESTHRIPWVGIDNIGSAFNVTTHLLELGHRRIAHIMGPSNYSCTRERYQGYCQALEAAGITPDPALLFHGKFDIPSGRECAISLFAMNKNEWPTAIFAANDQMAYGLLEIAEEQGIQIPQEVALAGFDDNILSAHMRPPLTTIQQPFSAMGREAIELLLTMIDPYHRPEKIQQRIPTRVELENSLHDFMLEPPVRIELPTTLVVRASSGAPRYLEANRQR